MGPVLRGVRRADNHGRPWYETRTGATLLTASTGKAQTDDDKKFLATAAQSDVNEIKLSQLAEEKATNPAVKAFAHKMVVEHKKMSASMKPFADSWGVTPPAGLDDDHQKEYDKLNGLSGADFDKEYIDQMVTDHAKALDAFTSATLRSCQQVADNGI